eukprot:809108-Amphidinium_carterae.1
MSFGRTYLAYWCKILATHTGYPLVAPWLKPLWRHLRAYAVVFDLAQFLKTVELIGVWPAEPREMLYLQLPKDGAREAGQGRPIAHLPQVYRLECCVTKDVQQLRPKVKFLSAPALLMRPLTYKTEARNAGSCKLFAFECGFPLYALNCAYVGVVSDAVQSRFPPGCGLNVGRQVEDRKYRR